MTYLTSPIRNALACGLLLAMAPHPSANPASTQDNMTQQNPKAFHPGEIWKDTSGVPINAHGGGMLFHNGTYYWYGEIKSGRTFAPKVNKGWGGTRVDAAGVSCYSSKNLLDWKNEGIALAAVTDDPKSDLHKDKVMERPKVIYNAKTNKFVMWLHVDSINYSAARSGVAVSDSPTGPFHYVGSFRPNAGAWPINATADDKQTGPKNFLARDFAGGQMSRDMTLFVDTDGKAYQFYASEENGTMQVSQLSDDYLKPAGKYARILIKRSMEAPAVFKRDNKYYLIASGCTGWKPNAARSAVAENIFGPWKELGNPFRGEGANESYQTQPTFVFPVQGTSQYIFMADIWKEHALADSRYAWLPIQWEGDKPVLNWHSEWAP